ncbi:MAG: efflux transporter outer membrane subunit [Rubrivivax sp.]|nr:efflux transporter outer membrane subunit [Rubrivivax sp.]
MKPLSRPCRSRRARASAACAVALLLVFYGCATPNLPPIEGAAAPARFTHPAPSAAAAPVAAATPADGAWWRLYADPALDAAVQRAMAASPQLQQALTRLEQSRALARAAGAAQRPQLGLNAGVSRQGGPLINAAGADGTLLRAGLAAELEMDVGGRLSMAARAAQLDAEQREALWRAARLQLQADVAATWQALRSLDAQRATLRRSAAAQHETARLIERRERAGLASPADSGAARAEAVALDAQALALDRERAAQHIALAHLLGAHHVDVASTLAPDPLAAPAADATRAPAALPDPPVVPPGIPSAVLSRRPDVAAAERAMQAARQRVGVAGAAALPGITLTASGGVASADLGELLRSSARSWGLGALLSLPLFDGGRRDAETDAARAAHDAAVAAWRGQMLTALREVEEQLSALRHLAAEAAARRTALDESTRVLALTRSRLERGLVGTLEVFDAERRALRDALAAAQVQGARHAATVALVRALGGGWGDATATAGAAALADLVASSPAAARPLTMETR